jgi:hypothetical protein
MQITRFKPSQKNEEKTDRVVRDRRLLAIMKCSRALREAERLIQNAIGVFALSDPGDILVSRELEKAHNQLNHRLQRLRALYRVVESEGLIVGQSYLENCILKNYQTLLLLDPDDSDRELMYSQDKSLEDIYG